MVNVISDVDSDALLRVDNCENTSFVPVFKSICIRFLV